MKTRVPPIGVPAIQITCNLLFIMIMTFVIDNLRINSFKFKCHNYIIKLEIGNLGIWRFYNWPQGEDFSGKVTAKYLDSRALTLVNLTPGVRDDLENASSVSVEETVVIRAPSTFNCDVASSYQSDDLISNDVRASHKRHDASVINNGSASSINQIYSKDESSSSCQKSSEMKSSKQNIFTNEVSSANCTSNRAIQENYSSTEKISEQNKILEANDVTMTKQFSSSLSSTAAAESKTFGQNNSSSEAISSTSNTVKSLYQNSTPKMFKPFNQNTQNQYTPNQNIQTTQSHNIMNTQNQYTQNQIFQNTQNQNIQNTLNTQNTQTIQNTQSHKILSSNAKTHSVSSSSIENSVTKNCHSSVQEESTSCYFVETLKEEERSANGQTKKTTVDTR